MRKIKRNILNFIKYFRRKDIIIGYNVAVNQSTFEGKNRIGENTIFTNCQIGLGSYIGPNGHFSKVKIGRYCSFGKNIKIITGTHPSKNFVSTHPAFFSLAKQAGFTYVVKPLFQDSLNISGLPDLTVEIGNDVWISDDVSIIGGIKIGDGAIIGAKALVTKDVEPYAIVGGVPARKIRNRFDDNEIAFLLNFKWWNKDEKWISENADKFIDIKNFLNSCVKNE
jgi:acetyltransferase-like isoleucine patch superfamily enzyme